MMAFPLTPEERADDRQWWIHCDPCFYHDEYADPECRFCQEAAERNCPRCGSELEQHHREGDFYLPECDWWECAECDYRSDPE